MFVVKSKFVSEAERLSRQAQLNSNPPTPGSILVTDETEEWTVIQPKLESSQAGEDGLALKKMIAAGTGLPMHFLAEPEGSTRTTAEAAGGPTFRRFEQRQRYFMYLINDVLQAAIRRRSMVDRHMPANPDFELTGTDISARDNVSLAMATSNLVNSLVILRDRQMIDDSEFLRLVYRFASESVDVDEMLARGKEAGPSLVSKQAAAAAIADITPSRSGATPSKQIKEPPVKDLVNPETGEPKDPGSNAENQ